MKAQDDWTFFDDIVVYDDDVLVCPPSSYSSRYHRGPDFFVAEEDFVTVPADLQIHKWTHDFEGGNERCELCDDVKWAEAGFRSLLPYHKQQL